MHRMAVIFTDGVGHATSERPLVVAGHGSDDYLQGTLSIAAQTVQTTIEEEQKESKATVADMFCRAAVFVLLSSGLCHGAGIIPVDWLHGTPGQSVTFTTSLTPTSEPFLALTWSFNATISVITSTSVDVVGEGYEGRVTLDKTTGGLVLANLTEEDSGEYEVLMVSHGAQPIQGRVRLNVLSVVSVPIMACPTENLIEGQSSLNLTCDAEGGVTHRAWTRKGKPLLPGGRFVFHDDGRVLSVSPMDRQDTGVFLCNVSNAISFATAKCKLKVFYGPNQPFIDQDPVGAELEESVTLLCSADSLPKAKFTWKFKRTVASGPRYDIEELQNRHLGTYTCTAHNEITGSQVSAEHTLQDSAVPLRMSMLVCAVLTSLGFRLI